MFTRSAAGAIARPVAGPRQDDIELATHRSSEHAIECRPVLAPPGAGDAGVLIDLHDLRAMVFSHPLKFERWLSVL
jgi:hypothetical protein